MPATNSTALALAARLREDSDEDLVRLLRAREVRDSGIRDFFDVAEKLLDPVSVGAALSRLDRPTLAVLAVLGERGRLTSAELAANLDADIADVNRRIGDAADLALVDVTETGVSTFESVATVLRGWPSAGLPGTDELVQPAPAALEPVSTADHSITDAAAADSAFATTGAIAELVAAIDRAPARELARGGIALPDSRRLAEAASVDLTEVPALQSIAEHAGLVRLEGGSWFATDALSEWMLLSTAERWARLAGAWLDRLPRDIRSLLGDRARALWGEHFELYLDWFFPAGGDAMRERVAVHTRAASLLGIVADLAPSGPGTALLTSGPDAAAPLMAQLFPAEVDKVYVQHDLTIVSPGPLKPHLDARLRSIADIESRALASSYRVSSASLNRALTHGETSASITEFLEGISLTGIPQPLAYVIAESAARHGLVRVGAIDGDNSQRRSYVRSSDASLLRTIRVDQGLASLGLFESSDGSLTSRFDHATVYWTLSDARYPVVAENADGAAVTIERTRPTRANKAESSDTAANIVERLRLLAPETTVESGTAWLEHQLEVAIRAKLTVTVQITMPDGATIDYLVQPTSLAGGRLRALDRNADIERTLPMSHITAVSAPQ